MRWRLSWRADPAAAAIADRHYNRQKVGSAQFVPPGRCLVLLADRALWVSSWPLPQYVLHDWPGAWVNSLFRNESAERASDLIREAVAATRSVWPTLAQGMVSFVDPRHTRATYVRGARVCGLVYRRAGFEHVGFTRELGLWAWQLLPQRMPEPQQIPLELLESAPHAQAQVAVALALGLAVSLLVHVDGDLAPLGHVARTTWQAPADARHLAPFAVRAEHLDRAVGVDLEPTLPVAGA
jgi:hypothetical protein